MQLLKIKTTPIEYEIKIEHAELKQSQEQPRAERRTENAKLDINTRDTQMRVDSSRMRRNLNMKPNSEFIGENADKGVQNAMQKSAEYAQIGKQLSQIQNGAKVSDVYRNKLLNELVSDSNVNVQVTQLGDPDITWTPPTIDLSYIKGDITTEWQVNKSEMEYVPGRFHMDIIQMPKVSIEYVGGPRYVPASADPNYEGEK